ncbi:hypothetical protein DIE23_36370 [Burkholderia sp. Bp9143]|uniref:hypothetical protein n=1 Tax=Burkholderia sp. Bp9143 TaxID=2184574 RepID=UPI000F597D88|nr:hypothetical protein [Burkholderia sp. Bp9143]RQR22610.1 hypothetical protein DIE23_36370 [Burkholderia sp. Bp9143]
MNTTYEIAAHDPEPPSLPLHSPVLRNCRRAARVRTGRVRCGLVRKVGRLDDNDRDHLQLDGTVDIPMRLRTKTHMLVGVYTLSDRCGIASKMGYEQDISLRLPIDSPK